MSATEPLASGFGGVGEGGTSFYREFLVIKPSDAKDDWHPTKDEDLLLKAGLGTEWPKLKGALCVRHELIDNPGGGMNAFTVHAIYEAPTTLDPGFGGAWRVEITFSLDVAWTYVVRPSEEERNETPPLEPYIVGSLKFLEYADRPQSPWPLPVGAEEYTVGPPGDDALKLYTKKKRDKADRIPEGMEWYPPVTTITCSRKFAPATMLRNMQIRSHHGRVNSSPINLLGRMPFLRGELMLADGRVVEVPSSSPKEPIAQNVTLVFVSRAGGWQHEVVHTYSPENETGTAGAIVWYTQSNPNSGGKARPVEEEVRRVLWAEFGGFLEGL